MTDIQELRTDFVRFAIAWGEALKIGDHHTANKQNDKVTKIAKEFKKDRLLGETILIPLFQHFNPSVRLLAAVHALDMDIHTCDAEDVLIKIAGDPSIRVIRLMAQINLDKWTKEKNQKST